VVNILIGSAIKRSLKQHRKPATPRTFATGDLDPDGDILRSSMEVMKEEMKEESSYGDREASIEFQEEIDKRKHTSTKLDVVRTGDLEMIGIRGMEAEIVTSEESESPKKESISERVLDTIKTFSPSLKNISKSEIQLNANEDLHLQETAASVTPLSVTGSNSKAESLQNEIQLTDLTSLNEPALKEVEEDLPGQNTEIV